MTETSRASKPLWIRRRVVWQIAAEKWTLDTGTITISIRICIFKEKEYIRRSLPSRGQRPRRTGRCQAFATACHSICEVWAKALARPLPRLVSDLPFDTVALVRGSIQALLRLLSCGLWPKLALYSYAKTLPRPFSYRIQTGRFRSANGSVFGAFLAVLCAPYRYVSPF